MAHRSDPFPWQRLRRRLVAGTQEGGDALQGHGALLHEHIEVQHLDALPCDALLLQVHDVLRDVGLLEVQKAVARIAGEAPRAAQRRAPVGAEERAAGQPVEPVPERRQGEQALEDSGHAMSRTNMTLNNMMS